MGHLSDSQLEALRRKTLSASDLLELDGHLSACRECRVRIAKMNEAGLEIKELLAGMRDSESGPEHLSYEKLEAYICETLDETDREIVESHLSICESCNAEMTDLQSFKTVLDRTPDEVPVPVDREIHRKSWAGALSWLPAPLAAAAVIAALVLWIQTSSLKKEIAALRSQIQVFEQAGVASRNEQQTAALGTSAHSSEKTDAGASTTATASVPSISLRDGGTVVSLDAQGRLSGLVHVPSHVRDSVLLALHKGQVETPGLIRDLVGKQGTLMGGAHEDSAPFNLLRPVGTVVMENRPEFSWNALPGASRYVVAVYDSHFRSIASSPKLSVTHWMPDNPLPWDVRLSWQVRAFKDGEEWIAPSAPSPEARFLVLGEKQTATLRLDIKTAPESHLVHGVLYARVGALDEAEDELQALIKANPDSLIARQLLQNLRGLRKP